LNLKNNKMQQLLTSLQQQIAANVPSIKYVDEDWGQLDYYSQHPPVQWPCCLFDISNVVWTNQGKKLQLGTGTIAFTVANVKTTNTSSKAPNAQREAAWNIHNILQQLHQALHGQQPLGANSLLYRKSTQRIKRDDGVQQYVITYQCTVNGEYEQSGNLAVRDDLGMGVER
jgi:hypothetical protein